MFFHCWTIFHNLSMIFQILYLWAKKCFTKTNNHISSNSPFVWCSDKNIWRNFQLLAAARMDLFTSVLESMSATKLPKSFHKPLPSKLTSNCYPRCCCHTCIEVNLKPRWSLENSDTSPTLSFVTFVRWEDTKSWCSVQILILSVFGPREVPHV